MNRMSSFKKTTKTQKIQTVIDSKPCPPLPLTSRVRRSQEYTDHSYRIRVRSAFFFLKRTDALTNDNSSAEVLRFRCMAPTRGNYASTALIYTILYCNDIMRCTYSILNAHARLFTCSAVPSGLHTHRPQSGGDKKKKKKKFATINKGKSQ